MTSNFLKVHREFTAEFEGGFNDIKEDRGGATNWGVSIAFLTDYAKRNEDFLREINIYTPITVKTIKNLIQEQSEEIFYRAFWQHLECEDLPLHIAFMLYDCCVNSGLGGGTVIAQRAYNSLLPKKFLVVDGGFGPLTKAALSKPSGEGFINAWVTERNNAYMAIVAKRADQSKFINGWLRRAKEMGEYAKTLL